MSQLGHVGVESRAPAWLGVVQLRAAQGLASVGMTHRPATSERGPIADSVRLAWPAEADSIAVVQRRAWGERPGRIGQLLLAGITHHAMADSWRSAVLRPPDARCRVLVAVADALVVGFATTVPGTDPDLQGSQAGELGEFEVDPQARGRGHGSRLLNACVDTLRADGFERAVCWVEATDDVRRKFLTDAGWAADGGWREIGPRVGPDRIKQVRLHTDLTGA
jgi:GNAT superfamily N-acetyltransferase